MEGLQHDPRFDSGVFEKPNKRKKANPINLTLKRAIWDMYIGIGVKRSKCVLCGKADMILNANSGYEAAHIIAEKYFDEKMTVYYAIPTCKACNNTCLDMCILDYLYVLNRIDVLRRIIRVIYTTYIIEHEDELALDCRTAHSILDKLYGPSTYILGGIQNTKQIYEIARMVQYNDLLEESKCLAEKQVSVATQMEKLLTYKIAPLKF